MFQRLVGTSVNDSHYSTTVMSVPNRGYYRKKVMKNNKNKSISTIFTVIDLFMKVQKVGSNTVINNYIVDGELVDVDVETKHHKIVIDSKRDFVMLSFAVLGMVDGLDKTTIKVIIWCSLHAAYNSNIVNLTKPMCAEITKEFDITYQTIKNCISKLHKRKILISLGSGTYRVNPRYFWKGQTAEKLKTMKYILEMECKDC